MDYKSIEIGQDGKCPAIKCFTVRFQSFLSREFKFTMKFWKDIKELCDHLLNDEFQGDYDKLLLILGSAEDYKTLVTFKNLSNQAFVDWQKSIEQNLPQYIHPPGGKLTINKLNH